MKIYLLMLSTICFACSRAETDKAPNVLSPVIDGSTHLTSKKDVLSLTLIADERYQQTTSPESYEEVKPILDKKCGGCHNEEDENLDLTSFPFRYNSTRFPNEKSLYLDVYSRLTTSDPALSMPADPVRISAADRSKLANWFLKKSNEGNNQDGAVFLRTKAVVVTIEGTKYREPTVNCEWLENRQKVRATVRIENYDFSREREGRIAFLDEHETELESRSFVINATIDKKAVTVIAP